MVEREATVEEVRGTNPGWGTNFSLGVWNNVLLKVFLKSRIQKETKEVFFSNSSFEISNNVGLLLVNNRLKKYDTQEY